MDMPNLAKVMVMMATIIQNTLLSWQS